MKKQIVVLGSGGHAKVLIEIINTNKFLIKGISDNNVQRKGIEVLSHKVIYTDEDVEKIPANEILLLNGIGFIGTNTIRKTIFEKFKQKGYFFASVIHKSAIISSDVLLGEGVQIMAAAVIQPGSTIGANSIINTKASVDHDCIIGECCHIAPGATICGGVTIGEGVHIGAGSVVIQGIKIGKSSVIGAGSLVISDIPEGVKAFGVPASVRDSVNFK